MKKIYLVVVFCTLYFGSFAATWYSQNDGDASILANWNSAIDGSGVTPLTFDSSGDLWIMQNSMGCAVPSFSLGGSLIIDSVYFLGPDSVLTIGGNLTLTGAAVLDADTPFTYFPGYTTIVIHGNLNVADSSYIINNPYYTTLVFNNTSSTVTSPQTISWTSPVPGDWVQMSINAGCVVQLVTNVTLPPNGYATDSINGTLICGNYFLNANGNPLGLQISDGATLYTANAGGLDSTLTNPGSMVSFSGAANYIFNGTATQVTGLTMPAVFLPGGSVTSENNAGVGLSQTTYLNNGSSLLLSGGRLILGTSNVNLSTGASLTGPFSATDMIVTNGTGQLQQEFIANDTFLYPLGDTAGNYTPMTLNVTGSTFAVGAYVGAGVTNTKQPNNTDLNNYLNRYWNVTVSGVSGASYKISNATYVTGDIVGSASNIYAGEYGGALPWKKFGLVNVVAHVLSASAVTDTFAYFTGISAPSISLPTATSICVGNSATINIASTGDSPLIYTWIPGSDIFPTSDSAVAASPDTTTTYMLIVTDGNGIADTAITTVIVNALPPAHVVTGGGSYCAGTGGIHIGLNGSDTGISYQLYYSDTIAAGSSVGGTGASLDFGADTAAGIYTAVATNIASGCSSNMTGSVAVVITPVVVPSVTISSSITDTICAGETIVFTAAPVHGGEEPAYQWMVNDTAAGLSGNTFSYIPVNGDIVSVKLSSDTVCAIPDTAIDSIAVVVHPHEMPTITLSVAPGDTVCEGTEVVMSAAQSYGGNEPTYTWVKNTVIVSTDSTYSYAPVNGDNVYCIMQSDYFCRSATTAYSNVIDMRVENPVVPSVYISANPGTYIGPARPDTLTATVTDGGTTPSYQWFLNGAEVVGATSSVYIAKFSNKDSVSCIVTRNDACHLATFSSMIIRVSDLGVQQTAIQGSDLKLRPNPNSGTFTVAGYFGSALISSEDVGVDITNMLGQVVYRNSVWAQNGQISVQVQAGELVAGMYILNLHSETGNVALQFAVAR